MRVQERLLRRILGRVRIPKVSPTDREDHRRKLVEERSDALSGGLLVSASGWTDAERA